MKYYNKIIKQIDNEIDTSLEKYHKIQNNRICEGLSRAIYKCSDKEALKLIELDNKISKLEKEQDLLRQEKNKITMEINIPINLVEHEKFKDNKIKVIIDKDTNNPLYFKGYECEEIKTIIKDCIDNDKYLIILKYIEFNNIISHEANKPHLRTIYRYDSDRKLITKSEVNEQGGIDYKTARYFKDGQLIDLVEYGLDNQGNQIYEHMINMFGNECMWIHNDFGSPKYYTISKYKGDNYYNCYYGSFSKENSKVKTLGRDDTEFINKIFNRLLNNKNYRYDIKGMADFYGVKLDYDLENKLKKKGDN